MLCRLKDAGFTDRELSRETGIPVSTIRLWRRQGYSRRASDALGLAAARPRRINVFDPERLPREPYAYLLGLYLGDGALRRWGSGWILRVALDVAYPLIIEQCCQAIDVVRGARPMAKPDYGGKQCVLIESFWKQWPLLFPQHGPGRKHTRRIELAAWQQQIVDAEPGPFLRGLIHSDGWRGVNRVHVKDKDYEYPRYQFSNRSDDIRRLFTDTCDRLGIRWRPWTRYHVSVAQRASVAILDEYVGRKSDYGS